MGASHASPGILGARDLIDAGAFWGPFINKKIDIKTLQNAQSSIYNRAIYVYYLKIFFSHF
jgi:hypothetical protein